MDRNKILGCLFCFCTIMLVGMGERVELYDSSGNGSAIKKLQNRK